MIEEIELGGVKVPLRSGGTVTLSSPLENKKTAGAFSSDEYNSRLKVFSKPTFATKCRHPG